MSRPPPAHKKPRRPQSENLRKLTHAYGLFRVKLNSQKSHNALCLTVRIAVRCNDHRKQADETHSAVDVH